MSKIRIKNFGPIKGGFQENDGWIDIKKVTLFIGNQGSGKSTIAKLISTFTWLEKSLYIQNSNKTDVKRKSKFENFYCEYQNLKNYFNQDSSIEYEGSVFRFLYKKGRLQIEDIKGSKYLVPKVMYVPAERNFVSAVSQPEKLKYLPKTLYTFLEEFERSKLELTESIDLPINNLKFSYDKKKGESKIIGKDYDLSLFEASSGLQSSIPLYLVSKNLSEGINRVSDNSIAKESLEQMQSIRLRLLNILKDDTLTNELKNQALDLLSSVTRNDCFINIVEEPEQNLFPSSQQQILLSLLKFNNINEGNKLIMTTHSPYLINFLTQSIKTKEITNKIEFSNSNANLLKELDNIVPINSAIEKDDWAIYELNENDGTIIKVDNYKGLPSDENYLNDSLAKSNDVFINLLEIEDKCL